MRRSILASVLALCLLLPAAASAADAGEEFEGVFGGFTLKASNGYRITGYAVSEHADGRGELLLYVHRKQRFVLYATPATVTATRLAVNLGRLGRIDMQVVPTGAKEMLKSRCSEDRLAVDAANYRGKFEFHGEEGYAEVSATRIPLDLHFFVDGVCAGSGEGEIRAAGLPGARLRARLGDRQNSLELELKKNRPDAPTRIEVLASEMRNDIVIRRGVSGTVGSAAFEYDPLLRRARVDPPTPFDGSATYRRNAKPANSWTGNLTVDLPGRSNVRLTGAAVRTSVVHAQWDRTVYHYDRESLGRPSAGADRASSLPPQSK